MRATDPSRSISSATPRAPRLSSSARIAIAIGALIAGLLAAECIVRVAHLAPPPEPRVIGGLFQESADPRLQYVNRPGAEQRIVYGSGQPEVVARVNEDGFRGPRIARERDARRTRVACFGDSHTFGYGVGEGESWPARLADALEREAPSRFECLNCGVNAYDTEQEIAWMDDVVPRWTPDVVLLQFYINDTAMRGIATKDSDEKPGFWMRLCDPRRAGFMHELRARSQFADRCAVSIYNRVALSYYARSRAAPFAESTEGWMRARAALMHAKEMLEHEHIQLAVVLYPCLWHEQGKIASHDAFQIVERFLTEQSIRWFDLEAEFAERDVDRLRVDPRDYHAGAEAHRIAGEAVARWLVQSGLARAADGR